MGNRILTMESLVEFCKSQKTFSFNAKETGHPLGVVIFGELDYSSSEDAGLMPVELKSCHIGLNRNGSYISEDSMNDAIPSFANKPILAEITTNSKGELDFGTHAMEFTENEDGELKIHYIEKPIGIVPESCNPRLIYDEEKDKTYLWVNGFVFRYYGNESAEILERKKGTKVSIEIDIEDMAWDAKNKWLDIKKFTFSGITCLGEDVGEGMYGSRLDISDFSHYESLDYTKELNEMKSRLEDLESRFSDNKNSKEGGKSQVDKLNELLAQYNKTLEDLDFDYEGLSDEELEAKFAEIFAEGDTDTPSDGEGQSEGGSDDDNSDKDEKDADKGEDDKTGEDNKDDKKESTREGAKAAGGDNNESNDDDEGRTIPDGQVDDDDNAENKKNSAFALSLQEKIKAVANLVCVTYEEADNEWYSVIVYDTYCIMIGWFGGQAYKQDYKAEGDEYVLVGDRVQVYEQYLTQEEIDALEAMKTEYSELKQFKANSEEKEIAAQRENLITDERFDSIRDTEEFKAVVNEADKYTLEELETKFKLIFADIEMANRTFAAKPISKQQSGKMFCLPSKGTNPVESKYGGIFLDK